MSNFDNYHIGDAVTAVPVGYTIEQTAPMPTLQPTPYVFDPQVDGYLAWLPPSEADFLSLVRWRVIVKGRRNKDGASTEPHQFVKHLMRATGSSSATSLAERFDLDPSTLRKYMVPITRQDSIRWLPIHRLRAMVANASVDQNIKHSTIRYLKKTAPIVRNFGLLTTLETGSMIRVLDQDDLYARVALSWRVRFGERSELEPPAIEDLPWLLETARKIATSMWNDHSRFQQLCLEEVTLHKGFPVWSDCRAKMHLG